MRKVEEHSTHTTSGIVLHGARFYDFLAWVLLLGREGAFREKVIDVAHLEPGEFVLDVGCGTGTLALAAKRRVGEAGRVHAIDASAGMTARARQKARKAGLDVEFKIGVIEALPFPDGEFDAVLSTLMFHHLPRKVREAGAREMRRVLKPGGRLLVVDFGASEQWSAAGGRRSAAPLLSHIHRRHGQVQLREVIAVLSQAELSMIESGALGIKDMHYTLARAACCH